MPMSEAILRRSALTRLSRSPPLAGSTRSTMSADRSRASGSIWISWARSSGVSFSFEAQRQRVLRLGVALRLGVDPRRGEQHQAAGDDEGELGQARDQAQRETAEAGDAQRHLPGHQLAHDVGAHVVLTRVAGDDEAGGDREQQGRDLGDEAVADGEQAVGVDGVAEGHAVLGDPDGEAADQVDQRDDDGGDRVALDELRGTVHRAVEVGLGVHLAAALAGLVLVDQAGVQVGVDGHLLAGHRVEGEAGADLGHAAGTVGDDDELDDEQDREHDQADDQRAADHEVAEGVDHLAGEAVEEHEAGGADVEREAEQRHHQDDGRERGEVERAVHEHRGQQDQQRADDVERDQQVEHDGRQRDDQHHHDEDDADGNAELWSERLGGTDEPFGDAESSAPSWRRSAPSWRQWSYRPAATGVEEIRRRRPMAGTSGSSLS